MAALDDLQEQVIRLLAVLDAANKTIQSLTAQLEEARAVKTDEQAIADLAAKVQAHVASCAMAAAKAS